MKKVVFSFAGACLLALPPAFAAMTWHWNATPSAFGDEIAASMNSTVATWNAYSNYTYDIGVIYASGTPTADAGYLGQIRFGGSRNYRTAMHESSHWMGTGTVSAWGEHFRYGRWNGTYVYNLRCAFDGPGERQNGDSVHYWPYGANQDAEGVDGPRMVGLIGAYRRDMALAQGDMTIGIASGTYRLRNRQNIQMLDSLNTTVEGAAVKQNLNGPSTGQQWQVALLAGTTYFTLRNVSNGRYLDSLGSAADGSPVGLTSLAGGTPTDAQQWQILATDAFFFRIVNKATGKALDTLGLTAAGSDLAQATLSVSRNQQWTFVHTLVQTVPAAGVVSQGRPVTSSSTDGANSDFKGNNGVSGDRWTASAATYPQWWRVDLGSVQPITKVATDWLTDGARYYRYRIEVSDDDVTYTVAADRTGNTVSGTTIDPLTATGRFVRLTVTGASTGWAAFTECRVYNEATPLRNLSQFRPTTASSEQAGNLAVNATDVDPTFTRWCSASSGYPAWWQVDLGSAQQVNKAVIAWFDDDARSYQYRIEGSTDGVNFTTLIDRTGNTTPYTTADSFSGLARFVRVTVTGGSSTYPSFYDAQIYGASAPTAPAGPANFAANAVASQINLSWSAVPGATGYTIKRATAGGGPYTTLATPTGASYADLGVLVGIPYHYVVSATNSLGEGADSTPASAVIGGELHAALPFDESAGSAVADISGFSRHGALINGPLWTAGNFGNAIDLDGTDDHVSLPAGLVAGLNDFTFAVWVNPEAISTWARVFDFGTGTANYLFLSPSSGGGTLRFAIKNTASGGEQQINATALTAGAWTHVAVTLSGSTGTLYVNGVAAATNTAMTLRPSSLGVTTQNYLGRSQFADPYFNGKIDDFRIYNRALTAVEIAKLRALSAPSATASLLARGGDARVTLAWSPVLGATGYAVKRAATEGGPYATVATVNANGYTDTGLTNGAAYFYRVSAANPAGSGADSPIASATPAPAAPAAPAILNLVEAGAVVKLSWSASASATSYQVKRASTAGGPYAKVGTASTTSYTDSSIVPDTTYYYVVSALNAAGESPSSPPVIALPTAAAPVATLKFDETSGATANDATGHGWNGTLVNGPVGTPSGRIGRALVLDGVNDHVTLPAGVVGSLDGAALSVWVRPASLANWARAFDFGTGTANYLFFTPQSSTGKPRFAIRSADVAEQVIDSGLAIATGVWTHVAVTFSGGIGTLYLNGVAVGANGTMTLTPSSLGVTTQNYLGRSQFPDPYFNGTIDEFRVHDRALTATEVAALATPPLAPTGLAATPGPAQVALSWNAVSGATGYRIDRATTSGGPYATVVAKLSATTHADTAVSQGTTYSYTVTALKLVAEGPRSAEVSAQPLTPASPIEEWRQEYFGTSTSTGDSADEADPDADGWTNAREFIAGTSPIDAASALKIAALGTTGDDQVIGFPSVSGKLYRLERSETLAADSWAVVLTAGVPADNLAGTDGVISVTDTNGALLPRRFYRVVVIDAAE